MRSGSDGFSGQPEPRAPPAAHRGCTVNTRVCQWQMGALQILPLPVKLTETWSQTREMAQCPAVSPAAHLCGPGRAQTGWGWLRHQGHTISVPLLPHILPAAVAASLQPRWWYQPQPQQQAPATSWLHLPRFQAKYLT